MVEVKKRIDRNFLTIKQLLHEDSGNLSSLLGVHMIYDMNVKSNLTSTTHIDVKYT